MTISRYGFPGLAAALLCLAACGGSESSAERNRSSPATAASNAAASPNNSAGGIDVTAKGFPFRQGRYASDRVCHEDNSTTVEYFRGYRHEWGADQPSIFEKIIKVGPDQYRITESIEGNDDDIFRTINEYERTGPDSFRMTAHVHYDLDDMGNVTPVQRDTVYDYKWCGPNEPDDD